MTERVVMTDDISRLGMMSRHIDPIDENRDDKTRCDVASLSGRVQDAGTTEIGQQQAQISSLLKELLNPIQLNGLTLLIFYIILNALIYFLMLYLFKFFYIEIKVKSYVLELKKPLYIYDII